jgi:hypothetical protein
MIRQAAALCLLIIGACEATPPEPPTAADDTAKYERWVQDLRARDSLQRELLEQERTQNAARGGDASAITVNVLPGERVVAFTGAESSQADKVAASAWPTFKACRTDANAGAVTLLVGDTAELGLSHPKIRRLEIASGDCHFVSGPTIEAAGVPRAFVSITSARPASGDTDTAQKAQDWLKERIENLEAEPPGPDRDALLEEFRSRAVSSGAAGPAPAQICFTLAG